MRTNQVLVQGMHGLGDNLHQRAIIRHLMQHHEVWLASSWVAPYHDLIADGLRVIRRNTALRTQAKNSARESGLFHVGTCYPKRYVETGYPPEAVRRLGSVLAAMCETSGVSYADADFRLPVPQSWRDAAAGALVSRGWDARRPVMLYRPLVERREWLNPARNPDHAAYARLFRLIRDRFFVVSVADLEPGVEWMVGEPVEVDLSFHRGELPFEALAGLADISSLVYCAPGFATVLAQAVGTPVATVFGGYENSSSFAGGARFTPTLGIDPIRPCSTWSHDDGWDKEIDHPAAERRLNAFVTEHCLNC